MFPMPRLRGDDTSRYLRYASTSCLPSGPALSSHSASMVSPTFFMSLFSAAGGVRICMPLAFNFSSVSPLAFWLGQGWVQVALLLGSLVLLLIVELLNSAIEAVVDRVSFERHELSKRAKDIASAAVLMALLLAAGIWAVAAWQHLL